MNETAKTTFFVVVAVAALAVLMAFTYVSRSLSPVLEPQEMIGKQLFPDFRPLDVTSLEIVKYNEEMGTPSVFEVAQVDGIWSIPSHSDYPADAKDQLAEVASSVMGLKVLSVAGDNPGDHELYGVLDPGSKSLKPGAVGVGTHVVMKGKKDKTLVALVIGKQVQGEDDLHYVRRVGQDPVYTAAVNTGKLSTNFDDWIEDDLLKLSTWDIRRIEIRDHSVDEANRALLQRGEMVLDYDDTGDPKWKMVEDKTFQQGKWAPVKMAEDEQLDTSKLDEMKNALDDLKIVDVRRKPTGLSGDLKAEENFAKDAEALASLMSKGFYVAQVEGRVELVSNEGEIRCLMKDGVEYVLRFGNIAGDSTPAEEKKASDSDSDSDNDSDSSGLNRYTFVMAEFNPDIIPKPELEPLPKEEKQEEKEEKPDETEKAKEEKPDDEATAEKADDDKAKGNTDDEKTDVAAERERIERENKRKQEEYNQKIADGKKRVTELNARFADWYYIISDKVYEEIHLGRDQIVKKKEKDEEKKSKDEQTNESKDPASPMGKFNKLKQEGPGS